MAKLEKWKRTLFWIVFIIVAIRIVYIGFRGELNKEYYTSMAYDLNAAEGVPCQNLSESFISQEGRLNSLELIFNNVADDKAGAVTLGIWKGGALLYQTNISLSTVNNGEWKRVVLNAEMQWNMEYTITLNANEECTQIPTVYVVAAGATEITAAYSGDDMLPGAIAINFGYLRKPGIFDRLSVISLWILFVAASFFVLRYFEKMLEAVKGIYRYFASRVNEAVLLAALELLSCLIMISSSGIEFQEPTKIILYIISLLSVVNYAEKRAYIKNLIDRPQKKAFLYFLYLYSAFALTGQRLLAYPLALKLTVARIFVFAVTVFWFVPVVNTLL